VLRHIPPYPYVREARALSESNRCGTKTFVRARRARAQKTIRPQWRSENIPWISTARTSTLQEHDLGESAASFPNGWEPSRGVFQLPFGVFVPEKIDGLLAAEKNISVSRLVNGAIRLQPAVMLAGQAVGTIAACAVRKGCEVRDVEPMDVQLHLLDAGSRLSMETFADVPEGSAEWKGGPDRDALRSPSGNDARSVRAVAPMTAKQADELLARLAAAFPGRFRNRASVKDVGTIPDVRAFRAALGSSTISGGSSLTIGIPLPEGVDDGDALTRGAAVRMLVNALP
jgi:hypothetical protein